MTDETTYAVRVRSTRTYKGKKRTTHTVRWTVGGREWQKTFVTAKLAEGHRSLLVSASSSGEAFNVTSGLPVSMSAKIATVSWVDHAIAYFHMKWPNAAPKYRKSLAESLTIITTSMLPEARGRPDIAELRQALFRSTFVRPPSDKRASPELTQVEVWLRHSSPALSALSDTVFLREVLEKMSTKLNGQRASSSTIARRRSALHNCLEYAVERKLMSSNPLDEIKRKRLPPTPAVDRRRVANPSQARALLAALRTNHPELEAFFATIYYAGPRPAEVMNLRVTDFTLPPQGWGELTLTSSYQRPGRAWTNDGTPSEERQLKHRAAEDTRRVPVHPELVRTIHHHVERFDLGVDGRLFMSRRGRGGLIKRPPLTEPVSMKTVYRAWQQARSSALTEAEFGSSLARRPYDLRHACLSTWLNAGVPATQVAEWAGHSVAVLLTVYAKCIDGQLNQNLLRIEGALGE